MKKLVILLALALVVAFAASSYAEVQNVKVGGDIRIRANYSDKLGRWDSTLLIPGLGDGLTNHNADAYGFINQRTRVITEADLTDNIAVNATIEADSQWGHDSDIENSIVGVRQIWAAGFSEAWLQLSELYYTPLSVKIGRQYLNYGKGFLISSNEYEYNFDAVKAVLNFEPWTIDVVFSMLVDTVQPFATDKSEGLDYKLWGGNVHYAADTWNLEGYVWGIVDSGVPAAGQVEPIAFGLRGDITPIENLDVWGELAYEAGNTADVDMGVFGANVGGKYTFANVAWKPTIGAEWAWGQGKTDKPDFNPLFQYNYWGYAFSPAMSNIHIINANLTVEPIEKLALILDYYHYLQDKAKAMIVGNPWIDNGGVSALTNGDGKTLGNELDLIAEYDYTEDVSTQLYLAWFWPGDAYSDTTGKEDAYEVRGEIIVSF